MITFEAERRPKETLAFRLFLYFQRLVALGCLVAGLRYWALLSGIQNEMWRFDLMEAHWQVASTALAVLLPVAAVGLWMPVSWGPVIWFVAAIGETVMYLGFPDRFGDHPLVPAIHAAVALIYATFRVILYVEKRRARRAVRVDSL
ncbi:DUF6163 family protein [Pararhizobium haloflavum]|uniref:DUF6163 family protein n=1 Tax=Pararhizobium haloflavum TaxID=2037914 RepID=UPI001FE01ADA|nr:DUF6163 family protein [Pararhizobium haloflavum]